jgi:hypothetical protein
MITRMIMIIIEMLMFLDSDGAYFVSFVCKYDNGDCTLKITSYIKRFSVFFFQNCKLA